jgi:hypothetical protein
VGWDTSDEEYRLQSCAWRAQNVLPDQASEKVTMPADPFEGDLLAAPLPAAGQDFDARRIVCSTSYLFWQDTFWGEAEAQRDSEEIRPEADESEARIKFAGYATFSTRDVDRDRALQKSHGGQSPWGHDVAGPDLAYETGPGDPAFGVSMDHSARFIERHSSEIHGMGGAIRGHQVDLPAVQEVSGTTGTGRAETSLSISSWAGERNLMRKGTRSRPVFSWIRGIRWRYKANPKPVKIFIPRTTISDTAPQPRGSRRGRQVRGIFNRHLPVSRPCQPCNFKPLLS